HHHRHRARAVHLPRGDQERHRRRQPHGGQAGDREGRGHGGGGAEEAQQARQGQDDRAGRHHLRQQRRNHRHHHRRGHGEGREGRGHHRRGVPHHGDGDGRGGGHAVRPRVLLTVFRDRPRADGGGPGEPPHPDP